MNNESIVNKNFSSERSSVEGLIDDEHRNSQLYQTTLLSNNLNLRQLAKKAMQPSKGKVIKRDESSRTELLSGLIESLDFCFFNSVYNAYNTIWQLVLKLPLHGDNLVRK